MNKTMKAISGWPPYIFTIVVAGAILWLTLAPHPTGDIELPLFPGADKVVHAIMFGAFAAALLFDRLRKRKQITVGTLCMCFIAGSAFGLLIEVLQRLMDLGRGFEWADWGADSLGAFFAVAVAWHLKGRCRSVN